MAKIGKLSEENENLVNNIVEEIGLYNYINVKAMSVSSSKQVVKIQRANPATEYLGKCPDAILVYIYEAVFDRLDDNQRDLILREAFNQVHYDGEKDKITITPPQICVSLSGRAKWGDDILNALEAAVLAAQQIEDEKKAEKESKKNK